MLRKRIKWLPALLLCGGLCVAAAILVVMNRSGNPATAHRFFAVHPPLPRPLVIAHRGGAGLWPENTVYAFERAMALGVDVLEIDVHATADGELVVIHDPTVDRTTGGKGPVSRLTLDELKKLDAGYRWTPDGGKSFPFRGQGMTVPTLREVFAAFPQMRFNIEPKPEQPSIVEPLCRTLREYNLTDRVIVGSFRQGTLEEFRKTCPEIATSASTSEASQFLAMQKAGIAAGYRPVMQALQVPDTFGGMQVITPDFVTVAHALNLQVHVWTINDPAAMRRMIAAGADGIMTDYPDRLLEVTGRRPQQ